jgi:hypothetical protein
VSWSLAPGEETLWVWCERDGFEPTATVDGSTFALVESATQGPGTAASLKLRIPSERVRGSTHSLRAPGYRAHQAMWQ